MHRSLFITCHVQALDQGTATRPTTPKNLIFTRIIHTNAQQRYITCMESNGLKFWNS